nr:EpsG family protein [uncultured Flavobacterium sp.]
MEIVIITNLLATFFAFLESKKILKNGLILTFVVLFLFLSIRYDFGNDYISYVNIFKEISEGTIKIDFEDSNAIEIGWVYLCKLFIPFGFYSMVAFLALANCFVFFHFVKKYVPVKYYWISIFIYLFNPFLFLVESSSMRQTTALLLFLYSIEFIINRNFFKFIGIIILASLIHKSAIILLPTYFIVSPGMITKKIISIYVSLFVFTFLFGEIIFNTINPYINLYFNKYSVYSETIEEAKFGTGLGFLVLIFFFGSLLYYSNGETGKLTVILKMGLFYYAIYPFCIYFPMFGRVQMYFQPIIIITMPLLIQKIENPIYKKVFIFIIIFYYLYIFIEFFNTSLWSSFNVYKTILFVY